MKTITIKVEEGYDLFLSVTAFGNRFEKKTTMECAVHNSARLALFEPKDGQVVTFSKDGNVTVATADETSGEGL